MQIKTKVGIDGLCTHLGQDLNKIRIRTKDHVWFVKVSVRITLPNVSPFTNAVQLYTEQGTLGLFLFPDPPNGYIYVTNTPSDIDPEGTTFGKILEILYERPNYQKVFEGAVLRDAGTPPNISS